MCSLCSLYFGHDAPRGLGIHTSLLLASDAPMSTRKIMWLCLWGFALPPNDHATTKGKCVLFDTLSLSN